MTTWNKLGLIFAGINIPIIILSILKEDFGMMLIYTIVSFFVILTNWHGDNK